MQNLYFGLKRQKEKNRMKKLVGQDGDKEIT